MLNVCCLIKEIVNKNHIIKKQKYTLKTVSKQEEIVFFHHETVLTYLFF